MKRFGSALLVAWLVFGAMPAHAATVGRKLILTDLKGDANSLTDQGVSQLTSTFGQGRATPVSMTQFDILSLTGSWNVARKKPTALSLSLELADSPETDPLPAAWKIPKTYLITFDSSRCKGNTMRWEFIQNLPTVSDDVAGFKIFTHEKSFDPGEDCQSKFKDYPAYPMPFATIQGNTLIFSVQWSYIAAPGASKTRLTNFRVETRSRNPRGQTPLVDVAYAPDKVFIAGK